MKKALLILAVGLLAVSVNAADVVVTIGDITVPDAAIEDVQAWLESQVLYETTYTEEVRTDPDTGEEVTIQIPHRTVVSETPKQKLTRIMRAAAVNEIRAALLAYRSKLANAAAQADVEAQPDPIGDDE